MTCREIRERLEAFLEDDLSGREKSAVEDHLGTCEECRREWMAATELLSALRSLPTQRCPQHVVREVLERTRTGPRAIEDLRGLLQPLFRPVWRPVAGIAVAVALVFVALQLSVRRPEPPAYSEQEIRQAERQTRWALSYVHRVIAHTQSIVQEEVIPDHVVRPVRQGLNTAIESIKKGEGES
jgi:anti-sigma factor RsiW